ncbi:MAG: prepilin peptidase, partial [Desulfotomaculales bacterium]
FLNACAWRLPRGESLVTPRSRCVACGHPLGPLDLVPVLSYLWLRGRCRYCGSRIPPRYLFVELAAVGATLSAVHAAPDLLHAARTAVFLWFLILVTATDLETGLIPDQAVWAALLLGLGTGAALPGALLPGLYGALAGAGILYAIILASRGGMGGGDAKMAAVMGFFLGWRGLLVALFVAFVAGGLLAAGLLLTGRKKRKDALPFAPFLALGGAVAHFWGEPLLAWYLSLGGWR